MNDQTRVLLIDGAAGVYVPRNFYKNFDLASWGLDIADFADLSNPDKDLYWDAWDDALRDAVNHDNDGHTWTLDQIDGDLFAIRDDHNHDGDDA